MATETKRSSSGYDLTPLTPEQVMELAQDLTPEERHIMLDHGTEPPFCGTLLHNKEAGMYVCRLCGLPLFRSGTKFESGTGWPSFYEPFDKEHITEIDDRSYGMIRTEIRCARCGGHLGHVFPDGPPPTYQRYCLNSASLRFEKLEDAAQR
ncbi:MAG TPA: peptide-methionine (R)-S-oxide reductase MsrB [Chloroflexota bacterium]|nr:peptide-methionine (R)-S-oxide reductase MsrB [Chloroflexota bacterium]